MDDIFHEVLLTQGRIEGKLEGMSQRMDHHGEQLDQIERRLRQVEQRSAVAGAVGGGVLGMAMSLMVEYAKARLGQ